MNARTALACAALLLSVLAATAPAQQPVAPDPTAITLDATAATPAPTAATPDAPDAPATPAPTALDMTPDDPAAVALLERADGALFDDSFFLSGRLTITRAGREHEVILRVHHLAPAHTLVEAAGRGRHSGTVYLLHPAGLTAWFSRAALLLDLPAGAAGQRLFGSDLSLEDLALVMGDRSRFLITHQGAETIDGELAEHLRLVPRAPGLSLYARVDLWVRDADAAPLRYEAVDARGRTLRRLSFSHHEEGRPRRWLAEDDAGGSTLLRWGSLEKGLQRDPTLFSPKGLQQWR